MNDSLQPAQPPVAAPGGKHLRDKGNTPDASKKVHVSVPPLRLRQNSGITTAPSDGIALSQEAILAHQTKLMEEDLKEIGRTTSWSKIKAAGKAILNKTASPKAKIQNHYKLNHKTQAAVSTGNSGLSNKLNANLFNWIEYAAKWNINRTQCLS